MHDAKTNLSKLVALAEAGEEVLIARNGKPVVRLVAVQPRSSRRSILGAWEGRVRMAEDFDAMPEGWDEVFGGA